MYIHWQRPACLIIFMQNGFIRNIRHVYSTSIPIHAPIHSYLQTQRDGNSIQHHRCENWHFPPLHPISLLFLLFFLFFNISFFPLLTHCTFTHHLYTFHLGTHTHTYSNQSIKQSFFLFAIIWVSNSCKITTQWLHLLIKKKKTKKISNSVTADFQNRCTVNYYCILITRCIGRSWLG